MSARPTAAILEYDAGNVRSARRGFDAAGARASITRDPAEAARADLLVVPGVGHFSSCLAQLRRSGLVGVIEEAIAARRPVFGICVGMQLLYAASDEAPDAAGLGLLPGRVERFPTGATVPHMGWNVVDAALDEHHLLDGIDGERVYFVHSYFAVPDDDTHVVATTEYAGARFPCIVWEGSVVGTQFHPEKSGPVGQRLLANWVATL